MVRIRILRGQAAATLRSLRNTGMGGLIVATAFLVASLGGRGGAEDEGTSPPAGSLASPSRVATNAVEPVPVARASSPAPPAAEAGQPMAEAAQPAATDPAFGPRPEAGRPASLLQLPESAEAALVFDLQANRMHVFDVDGERSSRAVGEYFVAVGKNGIDKQREGDEKTPVGIYFISSYIAGDTLPAIYGVGAFPITYPNAWDRRLGRTGSGIWIHGTDKDEESLLPQSSRGCLTLRNSDFQTMARFVRVKRTPVIVSDEVSWTSAEQIEAQRSELAAAVEAWRRDWESLDTEAYLRHYSPTFRSGAMDLAAWTTHKRRVNASKSYIRIGVGDLGIYRYPGEPELFLVTFEQDYRSDNFSRRRWKHQYWRREDREWRIVQESGS